MNQQTLIDVIDEMIAELVAVRAAVEGGLVVRIRDGFNGHPRSPSFEAGAAARARRPEDLPDELRGSLDYADPVGAVVAATGARDSSQQDGKTLVGGLTMMRRQSLRVRDVRVRYEPRHASLFDQQESAEPEPGCESCARVAAPGSVGKAKSAGVPYWNPVARQVTLADGRKVGLCEWCRVQARGSGEMPDVADVESYRDTGRARRRVG